MSDLPTEAKHQQYAKRCTYTTHFTDQTISNSAAPSRVSFLRLKRNRHKTATAPLWLRNT
eukprot:scaffold48890_cov19-Prasinocladus_malaysianus.AAC.1